MARPRSPLKPDERREEPVVTRFAKLAVAAAVATFVLIAAGGLVRATDSGLGCPDWPLCFGDWVPPAELHAWIEHTHRLIAAVFVGPLVGAVALITVFTDRRHDTPLLIAAVVAGVLVIVQSLLGAAVVLQGLAAELVTAHLAMALTVFACTIFIAERATLGPMPAAHLRPTLTRLAAFTGIAIFAQMLLGSWVTGHHAGLAYTDFPLTNGSLLPEVATTEQAIHLAHRFMSLVVGGLVLASWLAVRRTTDAPLPRRLATLMLVLIVVQIALGGLNVVSSLSALFVVPHLAVGTALWGLSVWLTLRTRRLRAAELHHTADPARVPGRSDTLRAYIALTKPRIIELLLVTTVPTMVLAAGGVPSLWLMAAVVFGGTLAAGGANAINMYVDRDIDDVMRRTRHRPLPRHAVEPRAALIFGIGLSVVAFAWLTLTVNLLSALLAHERDRVLRLRLHHVAEAQHAAQHRDRRRRRMRPRARGLGGRDRRGRAAGARAVRRRLLLDAAALLGAGPALPRRLRGRERADAPVVRGEAETARQIVLYTIALIGVSLLLLPAAGMGWIYLVAAVVLGGLFLWGALRLRADAGDGRAAIRLFRYSISYLTLLFAAVAVDALLRLPIG